MPVPKDVTREVLEELMDSFEDDQVAALRAGRAAVVGGLVYAAAVGMNLARGRRDIDCGCAGFGRRQSLHEWLLARNLLYVVIAGGAALVPVARPLTWFDALTALLAVSALAALAMAFDGLAALAPSFRRLDERAGVRHSWYRTCCSGA